MSKFFQTKITSKVDVHVVGVNLKLCGELEHVELLSSLHYCELLNFFVQIVQTNDNTSISWAPMWIWFMIYILVLVLIISYTFIFPLIFFYIFFVYFQGWFFFFLCILYLDFLFLTSYNNFQHYCTRNHKKDCSSSSMVLGREDILGKTKLIIKIKSIFV